MAPALLLTRGLVAAGTALFQRALGAVDDAALTESTALPGWTRAHVVAHLVGAQLRELAAAADAIQSQVVVPLGVRGAELLTESARWAEAFGELGQTAVLEPRAGATPIDRLNVKAVPASVIE